MKLPHLQHSTSIVEVIIVSTDNYLIVISGEPIQDWERGQGQDVSWDQGPHCSCASGQADSESVRTEVNSSDASQESQGGCRFDASTRKWDVPSQRGFRQRKKNKSIYPRSGGYWGHKAAAKNCLSGRRITKLFWWGVYKFDSHHSALAKKCDAYTGSTNPRS